MIAVTLCHKIQAGMKKVFNISSIKPYTVFLMLPN